MVDARQEQDRSRHHTMLTSQQSHAFRIGSVVYMLQTHAPHARASTCPLPAWSRAPSARLDTGTPLSHPLIPPYPSEHVRYRMDTTSSDCLPLATTFRLSARTKLRLMEPNSTQRIANTSGRHRLLSGCPLGQAPATYHKHVSGGVGRYNTWCCGG
jgi:hypothetical protein